MEEKRIVVFDTTLRDGAQAEGISFSVEDKIKITMALDKMGVAYIEAGNPGSNPKDLEFFERIKAIDLKNAKIAAFGSTRRMGVTPEEDNNLQSLLKACTEDVVIFGKSWDFHVTDILKTSLEENLKMIADTVAYLVENKRRVIFDAEHFFDGYKNNPQYAMRTLTTAFEAGAEWVVLCDTNGGCFPTEIYDITKEVVKSIPVKVGIHCHNDGGMAVANTIAAVDGGALQIQGTFLGFGERCGNANLSTIIPNLQLKKELNCIPLDEMKNLTATSRYIAEVANVAMNEREPYIGNSAFSHKGGMHIDGVTKAPHSFEHIPPEVVGNERRFLMSEVSGRSTIISEIQKVSPNIRKDSPEVQSIIDDLKSYEHMGYQFEGAEATVQILIRKKLGKYKPFFQLKFYKVMCQHPPEGEYLSTAYIKIKVNDTEEISIAEGNGPVNALDKALRKALEVFYPELKSVHLTDYKVRVLDTNDATAATVRVLIQSTDGVNLWNTVGVSTDIIKASWLALVDSIEYKLLKDIERKIEAFI